MPSLRVLPSSRALSNIPACPGTQGHTYTRRTDHDLDSLNPDLPLRDVVQDLDTRDPTQEHELNRSYSAGIYLP